jgi:creatinine amidohydrolase
MFAWMLMRGRAAAALILAAALLASGPMAHAASSSVYLEDLTWTELRDRIAAGASIAIIPIGGTEQSGPALALGKHNVRVRVLAGQIARALGNAIVAPVVAYVPEGTISPPTGHMRFPGTLTVTDAVFESLLESAAESLKHAGFTTMVLIGDHGGYQQNEASVVSRLNSAWKATSARAFADLDYYAVTQKQYVAALAAAGISTAAIGTHAGLADTSLMLAIDSSLVRIDLLGGAAFTAQDGVEGDPRGSTGSLGQIGVDLIVTTAVSDIRAFIANRHPGS